MIQRGCIYLVRRVFRDPKPTRPILVMTADARNQDPRSPTVVGIPVTSSNLKGGRFRVRLRAGTGGLDRASELACEQVLQIPKRNFVRNADGDIAPLGPPLTDTALQSVIDAVVEVLSP